MSTMENKTLSCYAELTVTINIPWWSIQEFSTQVGAKCSCLFYTWHVILYNQNTLKFFWISTFRATLAQKVKYCTLFILEMLARIFSTLDFANYIPIKVDKGLFHTSAYTIHSPMF